MSAPASPRFLEASGSQLPKYLLVLLAASAALAQPVSAQQIKSPSNNVAACSPAQQRKATRCSNRFDFWVHQHDYSDDDQKECCKLMASYFGPNATIDGGANCFCDADVWAATLEREKGSYLAYGTTFDGCTGVGYPIYYYQDGAGPCNASTDAAPAPAPVPAVKPHTRSFGAWMRSMDSNPVLIAAWIVTIPSVVGFTTVVVWPFAFCSALEVSRLLQTARAHRHHKKVAKGSVH